MHWHPRLVPHFSYLPRLAVHSDFSVLSTSYRFTKKLESLSLAQGPWFRLHPGRQSVTSSILVEVAGFQSYLLQVHDSKNHSRLGSRPTGSCTLTMDTHVCTRGKVPSRMDFEGPMRPLEKRRRGTSPNMATTFLSAHLNDKRQSEYSFPTSFSSFTAAQSNSAHSSTRSFLVPFLASWCWRARCFFSDLRLLP